MDQIIETVTSSLQDMLESTIKVVPSLVTALIIFMLTRYISQITKDIAERIGEKALQSKSLRLLFANASHIGTWILGIIFACVVAFPGLRLGDIFPGLRLGDIIATLGLISVLRFKIFSRTFFQVF